MMTAAQGAWELAVGSELIVDGAEWRVEGLAPHLGRLTLTGPQEARWEVSDAFLAAPGEPRPRMVALTISAINDRLPPRRVDELAPLLLRTAREMTSFIR